MSKEKLKEIIKLKEKLDLLVPYINDNEMLTIIEWAREDVNEILKIRDDLARRNLLQDASKYKKENDLKINKIGCIKKDILNVYRNIEKELNYWRIVNLEIKLNVKDVII